MTFYLLSSLLHKDGTVILTLSADEYGVQKKERLTLTEKSYEKAGAPKKGTILSEADAEALRTAHRRYGAVRRALSILAFSDNSEALLYRKLRMRKIGCEDARFAVAYVKAKGLLNEREQLDRLVLRMANEKLYGRTRLSRALCEKGYRTADISESIDALLKTGELDFEAIKRTLYEKKKPKDREEWKKIAYTHGFFLD